MTATAAVTETRGLVETARHFRMATETLKQLVEDRRVRHVSRRRHGRGYAYELDWEHVAEDLQRLPRCLHGGCDRWAPGPSGYCGDHFGAGGRRGAAKLEADILAADRDWYTVTEVRARSKQVLGRAWSQKVIADLIADGTLSSDKIGRHQRIPKTDVDALLAAGWLPTLGRRAGEGTDPELPARRALAARRYRAGDSIATIADDMGVGPTTVGRWLRDEGVETRVGRPPLKYPDLGERPCAFCGDRLPPRPPSQDRRAGGAPRMFCCDEHARLWRAGASQAVHRAGLLTTAEAAALLGVGERRVGSLRASGLLPATAVEFPGMLRAVYGFATADLEQVRRSWARSLKEPKMGRRLAALDPDLRVQLARRNRELAKLAREHAGDEDLAERLIRERAERRRADLFRRRGGRKRAAGPSDMTRRWIRLVAEWLERYPTDSHTQACRMAALDDWQAYPDDWPRRDWPSDKGDDALREREYQPAEDRVRKAVVRWAPPGSTVA